MRLSKLYVSAFHSIKERVELPIDPNTTVLIGANDSGKTNLLEAIRTLNEDRLLTGVDENWDSIGQNRMAVEHEFTLNREEIAHVEQLANEHLQKTALESGEPVESTPSDALSAINLTVKALASLSSPSLFTWSSDAKLNVQQTLDGGLTMSLPKVLSDIPEIRKYLLTLKPRIELFRPIDQLMDSVTLAELESSEQEFMQGVFRYADLWDDRAELFTQTPATSRRLEQASRQFTTKIRDEWKQGENLVFTFQHAGQEGNRIQLMIVDPAVTKRYVRPSERSEGFSAFFRLSMRMLARTEAHNASSYILLFDEPGTSLHPSGQVNLQRVFERLSGRDQIIYSTHSLFMVNHNRPERNRVISKDDKGTRVNQKPYLKNWRAIKDCLGLVFAGNFFIADTTLLVEGESDALYIGALLAALDRSGRADVDLNLFSVQWAGNARDVEPMARLMLEEGRNVVALMDGDRGGNDVRGRIERLNGQINEKAVLARAPVTIVQLPKHWSTEDLLPDRPAYFGSVAKSALELVAGKYREWAEGLISEDANLRALLAAGRKDNVTLGKHVEGTSAKLFKKQEPISKLLIARNYIAGFQEQEPEKLNMDSAVPVLKRIIDALKLESKASEKKLFEVEGEELKAAASA